MSAYEMKRELLNFSKNISNGVDHPIQKFYIDMQFGLAKSDSLISEIARSLNVVKKSVALNNLIVLFDDNEEKNLNY